MTKHVSIERELPHFYCFKLHKLIHKTRYRNHLLKSQRIEKDKHEIQTRLESKKKGKSTIYGQLGHRQANTSRQKRKTKMHSMPKEKSNDYERSSFKEHS